MNEPVSYLVRLYKRDEDPQFACMRTDDGILITTVLEDGAFHRAGVRPGRLVSMDGTPTNSVDTLQAVYRTLFERNQLAYEVTVIPDLSIMPLPPYKGPHPPSHPQPQVQPPPQPTTMPPPVAYRMPQPYAQPMPPRRSFWIEPNRPGEDLGFHIEICNETGVIRVIEIKEGKAFHRAGVVPGQVISLNGKPTRCQEEFVAAIREAAELPIFELILAPEQWVSPLPPYNPSQFGYPHDNSPKNGGSPESRSPELIEKELSDIEQTLARLETTKAPTMDMNHTRTGTGLSVGPVMSSPDTSGLMRVRPKAADADVAEQPLYSWAMTNKTRIIYLRDSPDDRGDWTPNGGVFGILRVLHTVRDWGCVRGPSGVTGYLRVTHMTYLPHGPSAEQELRFSQSASPLRGSPASPNSPHGVRSLYDPVEKRWFQLVPEDQTYRSQLPIHPPAHGAA
eukprot:TRINITY_DN27906_c0_g1_i1.p2 TRINITY_DN27906_c0_g1~~TRINITY_DN27906_c0_g1_i1.p2  ORF type:complete len:450 (+),score=65.50 TRINITY_DN27906_c0_g1_i1:2-1351(+)